MNIPVFFILLFGVFSHFCGIVAAYDADAKIEELKVLQAAMNKAQQEQKLPEAKRIADEIKNQFAELEARREENAISQEVTPGPNQAPTPPINTPADLHSQTVGNWQWGHHSMNFQQDGKFTEHGPNNQLVSKGSWAIEANSKIILKHSNGWVSVMRIHTDQTTGGAYCQSPSGIAHTVYLFKKDEPPAGCLAFSPQETPESNEIAGQWRWFTGSDVKFDRFGEGIIEGSKCSKITYEIVDEDSKKYPVKWIDPQTNDVIYTDYLYLKQNGTFLEGKSVLGQVVTARKIN